MRRPDVTIVITQRERFSGSRRSLESIYDHSSEPFELIYVDANSPGRTRRYLKREARNRGFQLIRFPYYLTPNEARNEGIRRVKTPYVVFIENDVVVSPGWLSALLTAAEETGAWIVGPLYLEIDGQKRSIHGTGRGATFRHIDGRTVIEEHNPLKFTPVENVTASFTRTQCDLVEFHCMLVRTEIFDRLGLLDGRLLNHREHYDLCFEVRKAGGLVLFEPSSVVTYLPPQILIPSDLPYFMLRWSESWTDFTLPYFYKKWGLDEDDTESRDQLAGWRIHRFRIFPISLRRLMHAVCGPRISSGAERRLLLPFELRLNRAVVPYIERSYWKRRQENATFGPSRD